MRVLVTGSSGFIGRHLVRELALHGYQVTAVDRIPGDPPVPGVAEQTSDLLDRDGLAATIRGAQPECVIHLAARTDLDERGDLSGYAANIQGVENLVAAIRATPGVRRAIYTSSQLVCRIGYTPESDDDYRPNTLYGESKVLGEKIVRREDGGGVAWCIVRPTTIWGPGMSAHYQRFFRMIAAGRYVHVGRRPLFKSFGYVGNVVHQYLGLLWADAITISRRTFYLADYEPMSLREWAEGIRRHLGAPPIRSIPELLARAAARGGDVLNRLGWRTFPYNSFRLGNVLTEYEFDLAATAELCGPLPYSMDEGVTATVSWLRDAGILPARAATRAPWSEAAVGRVPTAPTPPNDKPR
ncbi:MAG TPA: NAD(P)-dependent oxidoreductase [Candidatus Limnocylindria bacterium]|jgi:nucleoside-diphosphate-sugar epimerase|nr:NAD(P)-dependent oxidoreductase [Candidatus Limnocylindria bacterium]